MSICCCLLVNYNKSKIFLGWLGVNVTRLAKSNLRKGRTHLEIVNLSEKFYIQTAFLEVTKQDTNKVGISGLVIKLYKIVLENGVYLSIL